MKKKLRYKYVIILLLISLFPSQLIYAKSGQMNSVTSSTIEAKESKWTEESKIWYLKDRLGNNKTGWQKVSGNWYYMNNAGEMQTGWQKLGGQWYYMTGSGRMKTGWVKSRGQWYYMNNSGRMRTGWAKVNGKWYYLNSNGSMHVGWKKLKNEWYYLNKDGSMQLEEIRLGDRVYRFNSSGQNVASWDYFVPDYVKYSTFDREKFDTDAFVGHFVDLMNVERAKLDVPPIYHWDILQQAADTRADDLLILNDAGHYRPDGSELKSIFNYLDDNPDYSHNVNFTMAENSGYAQIPGFVHKKVYDGKISYEEIFAQLFFGSYKSSINHYNTMINPDYEDVAVGLEYNPDLNIAYTSMIFAHRIDKNGYQIKRPFN